MIARLSPSDVPWRLRMLFAYLAVRESLRCAVRPAAVYACAALLGLGIAHADDGMPRPNDYAGIAWPSAVVAAAGLLRGWRPPAIVVNVHLDGKGGGKG